MGFLELVVIAVIALIVFGPEKLPKVVYDVGQVWKSLRSSATQIRREFEHTVVADIKNDIHNTEVMRELEQQKIAAETTLETLKEPLQDTTFNTQPTKAADSVDRSND